MSEDPNPAAAARQRLMSAQTAVLGTLSTAEPLRGWPFPSVVPYALDPQGCPIILIASIAQHTRNLLADPRASLLLRAPEGAGDAQASWRLALLGRMRQLLRPSEGGPEGEAWDELEARYLARVPAASRYREAHGFEYWAFEPLRARHIEGFGSMGWIDGEALIREPKGGGIAEAEAGALAHMHRDHPEAVALMARLAGLDDADEARMVAVWRDGVSLTAGGRRAFLGFGEEVDAAGLRGAVVALTQRARAAAGG